MKLSNLALRLEEIEEVTTLRAEARQEIQTVTVAANGPERRAPRRLSLTTRRILVRDPGHRQFRVF